ncbi:MAG: PRC-barrel domain-containing protein [Luteolibacter sp.]|uniref:PRC-barrel domain-containing protein n=1 Tax=Luteolibacter sp. TaxID=1962973 RepID=UPI003263D952
MLRNIKDIYGIKLAATDGDIGHVKDFYFDDQSWIIRYLIVDTGSWLQGRQVLLAPHAFDGFGPDGETLSVRLTKEQIENSPSIESHRPVTRQHEKDYYHYYSWPAYWDSTGLWGIGGLPTLSPSLVLDNDAKKEREAIDDVHLRSTRAVAGYAIEASDGLLGHVTGFLVDHKSWAIADLIVETGHWYAGKQILISTASILNICYEDSKVSVKLTRADIQSTLEDDVARPAFSER